MKCEIDLIKDIGFGDYRDNVDDYREKHHGVSDHLPIVHEVDESVIGGSFSPCNSKCLIDKIKYLGTSCRCIVEIGVDRADDGVTATSTRAILKNKLPETLYLGIDVLDKSYIIDHANNVHFIQTTSQNTREIVDYLRSNGKNEIDFLFIDGWHSINQVCADWELTQILSSHGIVGFHDSAYHPGPNLFLRNLDTRAWNVIPNECADNINDYGIGFAWKKL
jgi:hypothetical protein